MRAFSTFTGIMVPLDRANVDTDQIIPKQYLKSIKRTGFGVNLFDDWRYLDPGEPGQDHSKRRANPDFVLNDPRYEGAEILLTRENFGCGSSREHAPWALLDHGFKAIIAPSYADIFYNNCFKNGLLPVRLDPEDVDKLFKLHAGNDPVEGTVDLDQQIVQVVDAIYDFEVDPDRKHRLINGLDDIGLTLEMSDKIRDFERSARRRSPWLFPSV